MFESDFDYNEYPLAYLITVRTSEHGSMGTSGCQLIVMA